MQKKMTLTNVYRSIILSYLFDIFCLRFNNSLFNDKPICFRNWTRLMLISFCFWVVSFQMDCLCSSLRIVSFKRIISIVLVYFIILSLLLKMHFSVLVWSFFWYCLLLLGLFWIFQLRMSFIRFPSLFYIFFLLA